MNKIDDKCKEITVLMMVDACRKDYLDYTEFIKNRIIPNSKLSDLEGTFGFNSTTGGWAAGLYPESSNLYSIFIYSPDTSPFKIFSNPLFYWGIKSLDSLLHVFFEGFRHDKLLYHSPAYLLRHLISILMKKTYSNPKLTLAEVPYRFLPYFDISENKHHTEEGYIDKATIFDIFRKHNKKWLYCGEPNSIALRNKINTDSVKKMISENYYDFIFLHIADLDGIGHLYGPNSRKIREIIRIMDGFIEDVCKILENKYEKVNMIVFSDHGMVEVKKSINLWQRIEKLPIEFGKDYIMFLDSPSARFWFMNGKAEKLIVNELRRIEDGKILTEDDYREYRTRFTHRKYWDLIFLANPSVLIYPNFFQSDFPVKGMHGYYPSYKDNQGFFLIHTNGGKKIKRVETIKMVDIFPTVLDLMELPVPKTSEGVSLLND